MVVGIIIIILIIVIIGISFFLAHQSMGIKRQTLEEARKWQEEHYDLSWYDPLEKTDYTVSSFDGYVLHVQMLQNPGDTNRYIIISHGYTDNRFGALKYAYMYLEQGFNVIIYDLRGHGVNEPTFCTYSARERKDLLALIRDTRERYPNAVILGLHGESLGAATSIAVLGEKPPVDFVVADCGFSEIESVLETAVRGMHLPGFLVKIASICAKIRFGYSYSDMRPIECLKDNHIPILFIHGAADDFILPEHSEKMHKVTAEYSELHLIPGAAHAMSILTDPEGYRKLVRDFLGHIERSSL